MKVLALSPNPSDGTSWYRSNLPLARMQQDYEFQFVEYSDYNIGWHNIVNFDILFLQRPKMKQQLSLANKAIALGLKIWIDIDDLITEVPVYSPAHQAYTESVVKEIIQLYQNLNPKHTLITVSTKYLGDKILEINPNLNVVVIKNAIDEKLFGKNLYEQSLNIEGPRIIGWRGSETHNMDLYKYKDEITESIATGSTWEFMGHKPLFIYDMNSKHFDKIILTTLGGPLEFFMYITQQKKNGRWGYWVTMLEDNNFNRCKSNIMLLEALMAGAVPIVPNWDEWKLVPEKLRYNNKTELWYILGEIKRYTEEQRMDLYKQCCDAIDETYYLKYQNQIRFDNQKKLIQ